MKKLKDKNPYCRSKFHLDGMESGNYEHWMNCQSKRLKDESAFILMFLIGLICQAILLSTLLENIFSNFLCYDSYADNSRDSEMCLCKS